MRSDVELLRVISALGIVWLHSGYDVGRGIAYSGLVVFLIFTSYFAISSKNNHSVSSRMARLLIPCLFWSAIYSSLNAVKGQPVFPENYSTYSKILSTPSIHLWYLPFTFFCVIIIDKIKYYDRRIVAIGATVLTAVLLTTTPIWRSWSYMSPLGQYMHATPAIFLGVIFALHDHLAKAQKIIIFIVLSLSLSSIIYYNLPGISQTYIIGSAASLIILRRESFLPQCKIVNKLSKLTYGTYLIHPLILIFLRYAGIGSFILPILGFLLSMLSIYVIIKFIPHKLTQYIV